MKRKTWTIKSIFVPLVLLLAGGFLFATATGASAALTDNGIGAAISLYSSTTGTTAFTAGRWKVMSSSGYDSGWKTSGAAVGSVSSGQPYSVFFKDVPGYTSPAPITLIQGSGGVLAINDPYVGGTYAKCTSSDCSATATANGLATYAGGQASGYLTVMIATTGISGTSEAKDLGAQWTIDDGSTWYSHGSTVSNLVLGGTYAVKFKTINGFTTPSSISVLGSTGQLATGTYTANSPTSNAVTVVIKPIGAVSGGGQWKVNGGSFTSGTSISGVSTYTISFKSIAGWKKPADVTGSTSATLTTVTAKYRHEHLDFNNDGITDISWRNVTDGATLNWLMSSTSGGTINDSNFTSPDTTLSSGSVVRFGDFNGDGCADILFDQSGGNYTIWTITCSGTGTGYTRLRTTSVPAETNKVIVGVGDFNSDGETDILTRDTSTGNLGIRFSTSNGQQTAAVDATSTTITKSDGSSISGPSYIAQGSGSSGWEVAGVADFDADGVDDISWRRSGSYDASANAQAGKLAIWLMGNPLAGGTAGRLASTGSGFILTAAGAQAGSGGTLAYTSSTGWAIAAIGDFDGDGKADVMFRRSGAYSSTNVNAGKTAIWYLNGRNIKSGSGFTVGSDNVTQISAGPYDGTTGWVVIGSGQFGTGFQATGGDDNMTDILWRYNGGTGSGYTVVWFMNGKQVKSSGYTSMYPGSFATSSSASGWYSQIMSK